LRSSPARGVGQAGRGVKRNSSAYERNLILVESQNQHQERKRDVKQNVYLLASAFVFGHSKPPSHQTFTLFVKLYEILVQAAVNKPLHFL